MWSSTGFSCGDPAEQSSRAGPVPQRKRRELHVSRAHSSDFGVSDLGEGHGLQFVGLVSHRSPVVERSWSWVLPLGSSGANTDVSIHRRTGCPSVREVFQGSSGQMRVFKNLTRCEIFSS